MQKSEVKIIFKGNYAVASTTEWCSFTCADDKVEHIPSELSQTVN